MKVCHILFCFIFLYLQDGSSALINDETLVHGVEGGNITVQCKFIFTGIWMMLCKEKCEEGNVLIETAENKAQSGRYSIEFIRNSLSEIIVNVSITQLKKSDSGWYRCTMDRFVQESYDDFQIVVTEASNTSTPDFKPQPFPPSASTAATATTQHLNFRSGSSTSPSASPETITKPSGSDPNLLLYVILILVVVLTVLSAALLMFCKKRRAIKAKGPPVEAEYADVTQANQLYEEIREGDRANSSLPLEVFSIYTTAKCPQADGAEDKDLYSLATSPQNKAEDDKTEVDYTEVDFSPVPAANSAPCGKADDVVYATPLVHAGVTGGASPPLYSAVKKL